MGSIHLITGPVGSGKTSSLVDRIRASALPVTLVRWARDTRAFRARTGAPDCATVAADALAGLAVATRVVAIDEGQFFADLAAACEGWARAGVRVFVAALDGDYARAPFRNVCDLIPLCETVERRLAVCACGAPAPFSRRTAGAAARIAVGGEEMYAAACRTCHKIEVSNYSNITTDMSTTWSEKMDMAKAFVARLDRVYVECRSLLRRPDTPGLSDALAALLNKTLPATEGERQMAFFVSFLVESADTELKRKALVSGMCSAKQSCLLLLDIHTIKLALNCPDVDWSITSSDGQYGVAVAARAPVARKTMSPEECVAVVENIANAQVAAPASSWANVVKSSWADEEVDTSTPPFVEPRQSSQKDGGRDRRDGGRDGRQQDGRQSGQRDGQRDGGRDRRDGGRDGGRDSGRRGQGGQGGQRGQGGGRGQDGGRGGQGGQGGQRGQGQRRPD